MYNIALINGGSFAQKQGSNDDNDQLDIGEKFFSKKIEVQSEHSKRS